VKDEKSESHCSGRTRLHFRPGQAFACHLSLFAFHRVPGPPLLLNYAFRLRSSVTRIRSTLRDALSENSQTQENYREWTRIDTNNVYPIRLHSRPFVVEEIVLVKSADLRFGFWFYGTRSA
jgi:hypothetical protein